MLITEASAARLRKHGNGKVAATAGVDRRVAGNWLARLSIPDEYITALREKTGVKIVGKWNGCEQKRCEDCGCVKFVK